MVSLRDIKDTDKVFLDSLRIGTNNIVKIIVSKGKDVGVVEYTFESEDCIYLYYIEVLKEYRGSGIGKAIIEELNATYTIVGDALTESVGFWEKVGASLEEKWSSDSCVPFILS